MVAVREHLVLHRQEGAAGIHQVDAGQIVLQRDFLRAQMLLHRDRIVGAALDRGVVGDDHAFLAVDGADAGDCAGAGHLIAIHAQRRQRGEFEEGGARIEQRIDALARQQLASRVVLAARRLGAAPRDVRGFLAQIGDQALHQFRVAAELVATGLDLRLQYAHLRLSGGCAGSGRAQAVSANSSRPISMRRISEVPAPISYSLASRHSRPDGNSLI